MAYGKIRGSFRLYQFVGVLTTARSWGCILITVLPRRVGYCVNMFGNFKLISLANLTPNRPNLRSMLASVVRKNGDSSNMVFPAANSINSIPVENMSAACPGTNPGKGAIRLYVNYDSQCGTCTYFGRAVSGCAYHCWDACIFCNRVSRAQSNKADLDFTKYSLPMRHT